MAITESNFYRQSKLYEKDLIAEQNYIEVKENYEYQKKRYELVDRICYGHQVRKYPRK